MVENVDISDQNNEFERCGLNTQTGSQLTDQKDSICLQNPNKY
jgi:hypothetical protein